MTLKKLQKKLFEKLWALVSAAPGWILVGALLLAALSVLASVLFLHLDSDQDRLVSPDVPFQKRYLEHLENFGDQEYIYAVIEVDETAESREQARQFADALAERLKQRPDLVEAIYYRIGATDLGEGFLYYASEQELEGIVTAARVLGPLTGQWLQDGRLSRFIDQLAVLLDAPVESAEAMDEAFFGTAVGALQGLFDAMQAALEGEDPTGPYLRLEADADQYFFTDSERLLVMRLLPVKDYGTMDVIAEPLAFIREALAETRKEFPQTLAGLTGRPVLQADEMSTTDRDMRRASVLAVTLVGLFFMVILRGWLRPLLIIASLLLAMAWTFGFTTATLGVLNLLSIVFALVLIGIGVDFGVHVVMRYIEGRHDGMSVEQAVRTALVQTGPGVLLGAVTSVCAFYAVLGSDFRGLAELGLIGGTGILLCLISMLVVLPSLLLLVGRRSRRTEAPPRLVTVSFLEDVTDRPRLLLGLLLLVTLIFAPGLARTRFNYNLLELQARGLESVEYEHRLIEASGESTWYAISVAEDLEQGAVLRQRFLELPSVAAVESLIDLLPERQEQKAAILSRALAVVPPPPFARIEPPSPDAAELQTALGGLQERLENLEEQLFAAGAGGELILLGNLLERVTSLRETLSGNPDSAARLVDLQEGLWQEGAAGVTRLHGWLSAEPVTVGDLPPSLRDLYIGRDGRMQLKVVPVDDVWQFDLLEAFVQDLRGVDEEVSGVPVGVLESARLMQRTFLSAALLTLLLVSLLLWLASRSLRQVVLTLLPLAVSMVWLLQLMGWLGLSFNLANFFAIPILIAIGVDGSVHFIARWKENGGRSLFSTSTPMAVSLSFITTMTGFSGLLLLGHHRGLASLGAVMVLGSATGLLSCLLVLPALLKLGAGRGLESEETTDF